MMPDDRTTGQGAGPGAAATLLREQLDGVLAESRALRLDVHGAEEARRKANLLNLGVLALLSLLVLCLLVIGWQNNQLAHDVRATNDGVADCTTPGGTCYEAGRQRTNGAISSVVRISIYVSQCGRLWPGESGPDYDAKLTACVTQRLEAAAAADAAGASPGASTGSAPAPSTGTSRR